MIRSLYDGVSGLHAQQVAMDVTADNIANVSTVGFKAGRVTFKEAMAQLLQGASRPPGAAGGTNPMQIGLGTSVGSIDTILTQGNMQSTGQITDLALEGTSYFAYSNGQGTYYSRNGALQFDSTGKLVCPTNGYTLQGMSAASDGTYPAGSKIGDITIPFGQKAPAHATTEVTYGCNLNSDSEGLGSIDNTNRFLADNTDGALGAQTLTSLYDSNGNALGIMAGDTLTVRGYDAAGNEYTQNLIVQPTSTLTDLTNAIKAVTNNIDPDHSGDDQCRRQHQCHDGRPSRRGQQPERFEQQAGIEFLCVECIHMGADHRSRDTDGCELEPAPQARDSH